LGCLLVALPVSAASVSESGSEEVSVGGKLGEATLVGLNGPDRRLSAFRGRPLLINVWASWCGPCRQEMSSLERLAWHRDRHEFAIIGISTDDYPEKAKGLLRETQATISQFIDTNLRMEHMLGASRLPLTVLVAADGRVLLKVYGARDWDSADALRLLDSTFRTGPGANAKSGSLPP
jgi:thiol-disulfide isomerase/thioredoxin